MFTDLHDPSSILAPTSDVMHHNVLKLVRNDDGLEAKKKQSLLSMLGSPEAFDHIVAGVAGVAIARAVTHYSEMSKPAKILLNLAGFGLGNILYNHLHENKFTKYNPETGMSKLTYGTH
jgi:hypothetical protein